MATRTNHLTSSRALLAFTAMVMGSLLLLILGPATLPAQAQSTPSGTTITVNTDADEDNTDGDCSLREAIQAANNNAARDGCSAGSNSGEDAIGFDLGSSATTITLESKDHYTENALLPTITDSAGLTIEGGTPDVTVSGNYAGRVFKVAQGAKLALRNLEVTRGLSYYSSMGGGCSGGGIYNEGMLKATNVIISDNHASDHFARCSGGRIGGGIDNHGDLELSNSTVVGNTVDAYDYPCGGGIANSGSGTLKVTNTTFSGNTAGRAGGGICNAATLEVSNSNFSDNVAWTGDGGAIWNLGTLKATNTTFSNNSAGRAGGGVSNEGALEMTNSTLHGHDLTGHSTSISGGIFNSYMATLRSTIVSDGGCEWAVRPFIDGGYNIEDANTCGFSEANNSFPNTDPKIRTQGATDNGGPTLTLDLLAGSPAIDAIPEGANGCGTDIKEDQRGVDRPQGPACDIGAFEAPPDETAPTLDINNDASPSNSATKVLRNTNISATFSEPMNLGSLQAAGVFTLKNTKKGATVSAQSITLSSDGKTVTFDPTPLKLAKKTKYEVRIKGGSGGAADEAGNVLATDAVWSFTTGRKY